MRTLTITMWPGRKNDLMCAGATLNIDGLGQAEVGDKGVLRDGDGLLAVWELDEVDD